MGAYGQRAFVAKYDEQVFGIKMRHEFPVKYWKCGTGRRLGRYKNAGFVALYLLIARRKKRNGMNYSMLSEITPFVDLSKRAMMAAVKRLSVPLDGEKSPFLKLTADPDIVELTCFANWDSNTRV